MGDLVRLVIEIVQLLWPFRLVHQWERAGFYVFGRWWREVGPGVFPVVPWFMDVRTVSVAGARVGTGRQDLTLLDGSTLSFSATVWAQVTNAYLAINSVDEYQSTTQETLASVLADVLAELDPDRLRPRRRGALFKELSQAVATECAKFGVETSSLMFPSFVLGAKVHRLLIDQTAAAPW